MESHRYPYRLKTACRCRRRHMDMPFVIFLHVCRGVQVSADKYKTALRCDNVCAS